MDYTSKSNHDKQTQTTANTTDRKKHKAVVTSGTSIKKKSELTKLASSFISDEAANLKTRIVDDIVVPTVRDTIWTAFTTVLETLLYGGKKGAPRSNSGGYSGPYSAPYINYSTKKTSNNHHSEPQTRNTLDFDHIVFRTADDAHNVLDCLKDDITDYGMAYVSSFYDLCNRANEAPYTANRYGWRSLNKAEVVRLRGGCGYIIKFPRAMLVD